jgi:hypothetical protein
MYFTHMKLAAMFFAFAVAVEQATPTVAAQLTMAGSMGRAGGILLSVDRGSAGFVALGEQYTEVDIESLGPNRTYARQHLVHVTVPGTRLVSDPLLTYDGFEQRQFRMEASFTAIEYAVHDENYMPGSTSNGSLTWNSGPFSDLAVTVSSVGATWRLWDAYGEVEGTFPEQSPVFDYLASEHTANSLTIADMPNSARYDGGSWLGYLEMESTTRAVIGGFDYGVPRFRFRGVRFGGAIYRTVPESSTAASVCAFAVTLATTVGLRSGIAHLRAVRSRSSLQL